MEGKKKPVAKQPAETLDDIAGMVDDDDDDDELMNDPMAFVERHASQ